MGGAHGSGLLVRGASPVHRLPAHTKLVALLAFVTVVVVTPRELWPAFVGYAVLALAAVRAAGLRPRTVARRMVVEVPFVAFAVLLPFVAGGPSVEVLGVVVSREGALGAWNLLAKGTLGVVASIVLAATTSARDLLAGLERLRMPPQLVQIVSFMLRYVAVVGDDLRRMHIARQARGFSGGSLAHARAVAAGAAALFIRTYERGERVHLAMLSRGWTGVRADLGAEPVPGRAWAQALLLPALAGAVGLCAAVAA